MKYLFSALFLLSLSGFTAQHYDFVKDFTLKAIEVEGDTAYITVEHPKTFAPARFELIPGQICLESFPPQCHGTIVRLDDQVQGEGKQLTTFEVDLNDLFVYGSPTIIRIIAPEKTVEIRY